MVMENERDSGVCFQEAKLQESYSGTPLNGHPSTVDTEDITDSLESPDRFFIDFTTLKTPELRTPRYSV